jgi:hypothetical protein
MSGRHQKPYHDDDRYMPIVDYSTPRRGEDLTSPNAGQPADTVIIPSTPIHTTTRVIEDSVFISERIGPVTLGPGEVIDMLSLTSEAGDIVSIEVVTDNPYTGVYLEMDDYKNREGTGVTAAELIMKNKITPNNREFYAEDMREDGTFVVKYSPSDPDPYTDRIKIQIRNDLKVSETTYGHNPNQRLKMRGGLPTPLHLGHVGGWYLTHPNIAITRAADTDTMLKQLGKDQYSNPIKNIEAIENPSTRVGAYHPYMNTAGRHGPLVPLFEYTAGMRLVSGEPGEKVLGTSGIPAINSVPWPGKVVNGTFVHSEQQFVLYKNATENVATTVVEPELMLNELDAALLPAGAGTPLVVKHEDTLYYLGVSSRTTHYYDAGTSAFRANSEESHGFESGDGAIVFTVSPGLPFKLPKVDIVLAEDAGTPPNGKNYDGLFSIVPTQDRAHMLIHEVVVRRKRTKTQLL